LWSFDLIIVNSKHREEYVKLLLRVTSISELRYHILHKILVIFFATPGYGAHASSAFLHLVVPGGFGCLVTTISFGVRQYHICLYFQNFSVFIF
jgi:hypothetical protein